MNHLMSYNEILGDEFSAKALFCN